jgi:hypothetical protein
MKLSASSIQTVWGRLSQMMMDGGNSVGAAAAIYEECTFLARGFAHVMFSHSHRESNRVAHTLACDHTLLMR